MLCSFIMVIVSAMLSVTFKSLKDPVVACKVPYRDLGNWPLDLFTSHLLAHLIGIFVQSPKSHSYFKTYIEIQILD